MISVERQKYSWLKDTVDSVFYPSSEIILIEESDAYRHTFKNLLEALEIFFADKPDLNVDADIGIFFEENLPYKIISFDIVLMSNPRPEKRYCYRIGKDEFNPIVRFEILKGINNAESIEQLDIFKDLGIKELYILDPEYKFLPNGLKAFHLKADEWKETEINDGRIFSPLLNLEIVDTGETLRLFNPETKSFLPTMKELESEVEKLKAELAKLKRQK